MLGELPESFRGALKHLSELSGEIAGAANVPSMVSAQHS